MQDERTSNEFGPSSLDLFRIVYRSRSTILGGDEAGRRAIEAILDASRRHNARAGLSGALMVTGPYFVQALEGPAAAAEAAFDRICCDLRHTELEVVECGPVLERGFGDWSMRYVAPDASEDDVLDAIRGETELADAAVAALKLMAVLSRRATLDARIRPRATGTASPE